MCAALARVAGWLQPPSPSSGLASSCNLILVMPNVLKLDNRLKSDDASYLAVAKLASVPLLWVCPVAQQ